VALVNEAAEPVATTNLTRGRSRSLLLRFGWAEVERAMWPRAVVVVDVDA
jgi:hypothetical protein